MVLRRITFLFILFCFCYGVITFNSGCAQISAPTGGPRDSIPPSLLKADPELRSVNFTGNRVVFTFDEYIDVQDLQSNVLVSPLPKNSPVISYNFRTLTVRFRDTLLPNTTYNISFGNAIRDLNEGNPLKDFSYTFSTGPTIDSMILSGKVLLAESGKTDSTIIVMLYRNADDSAVIKTRPQYISKVKADGSFRFNNMPPDNFQVYALRDGDGSKTYNSKTEAFAFLNEPVTIRENTEPVTLYAYQLVKETTPSGSKTPPEKRLRYTTNLNGGRHDVLSPLVLNFNNIITSLDEEKILLTDTNYNVVQHNTTLDSTRKNIKIESSWMQDKGYVLIIPVESLKDTLGNSLLRTDTIRFTTNPASAYGSLVLRFTNLNVAANPVIQFIENDAVKHTSKISGTEWTNRLFPPGEYEIRILYDDNNNGVWDPGDYTEKRQPEKATSLPGKISVRANWDNERNISL